MPFFCLLISLVEHATVRGAVALTVSGGFHRNLSSSIASGDKASRGPPKKSARLFAAGVVPYRIVPDGSCEVLLIQLLNRDWGFPKGRQESTSETLESVAIREFAEETGISTKNLTILNIPPVTIQYDMWDRYSKHQHSRANRRVKKEVVFYLGFVFPHDVPVNVQKSEIMAFKWVPRQLAKHDLTHETSRTVLEKFAGSMINLRDTVEPRT